MWSTNKTQTHSVADMSHTKEKIIGLETVRFASSVVDRCAGEHPLNVCVVYQDPFTHNWADEFCGRVAKLVNADALRATWWNLTDMSEPAVLAGAVSTALRADVLVLAVHAAEGFPLPFYVWAHSWVPHRPQGTAAVVALLAVPKRPSPEVDRAREYLRGVADEARLEFFAHERKTPEPAPAADLDLPATAACSLPGSAPTPFVPPPRRRPRLNAWRSQQLAAA